MLPVNRLRLIKRKYLGIAVIILSIMFLVAQAGFLFPSNLVPFPQHSGTAVAISLGFLIGGVYLVAGPVGVLIALVPLASSGCTGCGGGEGQQEEEEQEEEEEEEEQEEEDLGEPPSPPAQSLSSRFRP